MTADALARQFRVKADGYGGLSHATVCDAIKALIIGPMAYSQTELQAEIEKVQPGTGVFAWVKALKREPEIKRPPKCTGPIYY